MTKEFEEKIKYVMGKVKFVKPGLLGLYMWWTESLEAHESLRNAEKCIIAKHLFKIADFDVQLREVGYKGNYDDSAIEVLRQMPLMYLEKSNAYSLKINKKLFLNTDIVSAKVTVYKATNIPEKIADQKVLFNESYPFNEEQQ